MSNKADLFADLLEYREVFSALKDFGQGYNVAVERRWAQGTLVPLFEIVISKRGAGVAGLSIWNVADSDVDLRVAVRKVAQKAHAMT